MKLKKLTEDGFHLIEVLIVLVVFGVIGFISLKVFHQNEQVKSNTSQNASSHKNEAVTWSFNQSENKYFVSSGKAPSCKEPFKLDRSPVDLSKIMAIGMPGAYRGYSYKPHGGLRLTDPSSGKIDIVMPMDAKLMGITRYYEGSPAELQYLLTFQNDCGISFRFDHIYTLTPALQKIAETTPEPKLNDTRSDPNVPFTPISMKSGELVATEIGFPRIKNFGFDFGMYDLRSRNEISKNSKWAAIHNNYAATEWFGRCWIDMLPGTDAAAAKQLAFVVINPAKPNIISDYCTYAPHTTLDFNNGQPTDG